VIIIDHNQRAVRTSSLNREGQVKRGAISNRFSNPANLLMRLEDAMLAIRW